MRSCCCIALLMCVVGVTSLPLVATQRVFQPKNHKTPTSVLWSTACGTAAAAVLSTTTTIAHPGFRNTTNGELSVASHNILAPFYHFLSIPNVTERDEMAQKDREVRVPLAIAMAKQTNADILCLQEVEGASPKMEQFVHQELSRLQEADDLKHSYTIQGYDSYLWSALNPNSKRDDIVGLCIAWRSHRHKLVASECFRRGMVVQMEEIDTGATFCIANVHLPARPAAIEGRLKSMASAIRRLQVFHQEKSTMTKIPALDGTVIVAGDFNCEPHSVTTNFLERGTAPYGTLRDRNYKAKVSKKSAQFMKHPFCFQDVYAGGTLRQRAAPVTVSLIGRGPGCMDQMLFHHSPTTTGKGKRQHQRYNTMETVNSKQHEDTSSDSSSSSSSSLPTTVLKRSRRKSRKERGLYRRQYSSLPGIMGHDSSQQNACIRIESVLASLNPDAEDPEREQIIMEGLPNVGKGFPSDHMPIGALFVPNVPTQEALSTQGNIGDDNPNQIPEQDNRIVMKESSMIGMSRQRQGRRQQQRKTAYEHSLYIRKRHNVILRKVVEWLEMGQHVTEMIRDKPLYKWKWTNGIPSTVLRQKMRAPDICCVLEGSYLVIVEISVSNNPQETRKEKVTKYSDLASILQEHSPSIVITDQANNNNNTLQVLDPFVLVFSDAEDDCIIPEDTRKDIETLARLAYPTDDDSNNGLLPDQRIMNHLKDCLLQYN